MAATACSILDGDILASCDNKPVGGAEPLIWVLTREDWNNAVKTYDTDNKLIVTNIALATGKRAYQWLVFKNAHKPRFTQKDNEFGVNYLHELVSAVQVWDNETKAQILGLADNKYVFIVENVQKTGDAVFEIYGAGQGLRSQDGAVRDLAANGGIYTLTMANDAEFLEPQPPLSFVKTSGSPAAFSYAATKAAVVALITPAA